MLDEDRFTRTLSQIFLLLLTFVSIMAAFFFDYIVYKYLQGDISTDDEWAYQIMRGFKFSFEAQIAPFMTALLSSLPVMLSLACFRSTTKNQSRKILEIGVFGKILSIFLIFGILSAISALFVVNSYSPTVEALMKVSAEGAKTEVSDSLTAKGIFTSILSFQSMYLVHILGFKRR